MLPADAQAEERRNRLWRWVDWRFLLQGPRSRKSLCFARGPLAEAVALFSDVVVEPHEHSRGDCDLAVAVDPDQATLEAAWSGLRPGGTYYGEWRSPLAGGTRRVRRQLEAAGFSEISCYWAWPWPDRAAPLFWLPVEAPQALAYFLATRPRSSDGWRRARNAFLQFCWGLGRRADVLSPLCVVARRPAETGVGAEAGLLDFMSANWNAWGLGPSPRRISLLLLTGGLRAINKVASLAFADEDSRPRMIVKLPRLAESVVALQREAAALRAIHAHHPGRLPGIPEVIFFRDCAEQSALGETVLAGQPLSTLLRRDNYRELALRVTDWLAELAVGAPKRPSVDWWPRLVEPALADFEQSFDAIIEPGDLRETRAILSGLGDLPLVPEQRDCSPWNVLMNEQGGLAVLDWESAEPSGLPVLDLVYFLTYLGFFLDGAMESSHFVESYRAALDSATFTGKVLDECQRRYLARIGVDPAVLHPLRLLVWLIHSRSEYKHFVAATSGQPVPATLRQSLFVSLWQAELARLR